MVGQPIAPCYAGCEHHAARPEFQHGLSSGFQGEKGRGEVGVDDGGEILQFGRMGRSQSDGAHQVSHARQAALSMFSGVSDCALNSLFVKCITLNEFSALFNKTGDSVGVPSKQGYTVAISQKHGGQMTSDVAAPTNQKK